MRQVHRFAIKLRRFADGTRGALQVSSGHAKWTLYTRSVWTWCEPTKAAVVTISFCVGHTSVILPFWTPCTRCFGNCCAVRGWAGVHQTFIFPDATNLSHLYPKHTQRQHCAHEGRRIAPEHIACYTGVYIQRRLSFTVFTESADRVRLSVVLKMH